MQMTDWCTAGPSKKQKPSRPSFEPVWRNAIWSCIPPKPRSSTAGMGSGRARIRMSSSTSSDTASRPRWIKKSRDNSMFCGFNPAVEPYGVEAMRSTIRDLNIRRQTQLSLADIARTLNPLVRGWIEYHGRYAPSALSPMLRYVNQTLVRWAMRKFKRFRLTKYAPAVFYKSWSGRG